MTPEQDDTRVPVMPIQKTPFLTTVAIRIPLGCLAVLAGCGLAAVASAQTRTIRVVAYNVDADIDGATAPLPGLIAPAGGSVTNGGVLEGIGEEILGSDPAQPIDILALEEGTSNTATVQPIVDGLNAFYNSPGMYAMSPYQATSSGGIDHGGGPNALVYNTRTVQLMASVPVDPPGGTGQLGSATGEYREVMRYELAPAGVTPTTNNEFYVYVSHYKARATERDKGLRNGEAQIIRNDEANNLPADARVLYVGDYNISTSGEASYQVMLAARAPNGIAQGRAIDPLNPSGDSNIDWSVDSMLALKSETSTSLHWRFDFQLMTSNVYHGVPGGLALVPGTYHIFGNNGTTPYHGSVNSTSNTALNASLAPGATVTAAALYQDLTTASDHLPVVADYTIPLSPLVASFTASPTNGPAPLAVTFTDTSTGNVTNRFWTFGDGGATNVTTNVVRHTYNAAGSYGVVETVRGTGGSSTNTQSKCITVRTPF